MYNLKYEAGKNAAQTEYGWVFLRTVGFITTRTAITFRNNVLRLYKFVTFVSTLLYFSSIFGKTCVCVRLRGFFFIYLFI